MQYNTNTLIIIIDTMLHVGLRLRDKMGVIMPTYMEWRRSHNLKLQVYSTLVSWRGPLKRSQFHNWFVTNVNCRWWFKVGGHWLTYFNSKSVVVHEWGKALLTSTVLMTDLLYLSIITDLNNRLKNISSKCI